MKIYTFLFSTSYWITELMFSNHWRRNLSSCSQPSIWTFYWVLATFQRIVLSTVGEFCFRIFLLLHLKEEYFLHSHSSCREIDQIFFLCCHLFLTNRGHLRIWTKPFNPLLFQKVIGQLVSSFNPFGFLIQKKSTYNIYMTLCFLSVNSQPLSLELRTLCDLTFPGEALLLYFSMLIKCCPVTNVPNIWHFLYFCTSVSFTLAWSTSLSFHEIESWNHSSTGTFLSSLHWEVLASVLNVINNF